MKILLTSSGLFIPKFLPAIVKKPIEQAKIGWVTTASKGVEDLTYLGQHRDMMNELGWNFEEIDIDGKSQAELRKLFSDKDVVHVEGGNTNYLLMAIRKTGFAQIIKELIERGVIYVGSSAGSYIMCPTIEMATWKKDNKPRYGLKDLTGLNYVPFLLFAHYKPEYDEILKKALKNIKYPLKIITDKQAILVDDKKVELLGEGEEIKLNL